MSSETRPIRILIAGDHLGFREQLRRRLASNVVYAIAGEASDPADAVRQALQGIPDVLLLDFTPPGSALDALLELGEATTRIRPVLLTGNLDRLQTVRALQLGARAVVLKESASEMLDEAIGAVAAGQYWIARNTAGDLASMLKRLGVPTSRATRAPFGLTARQLEITSLVAAGLPNREIAQKLGISEDTVKHYLTQIFVKTGSSSRVELAMLAVRHDLHQSR